MITSATFARFCTAALLFAGACGDNGTQLLPIGSPCTADSQCGTGVIFVCVESDPKGYCQRDCRTDTDCPPEAICAFTSPTGGECRARCTTVSDCRKSDGYVCRPAQTASATPASHAYCDLPLPGGSDGGAAPSDGGSRSD